MTRLRRPVTKSKMVLSHDGEAMGHSTLALNTDGKTNMLSAYVDRIVSIEIKLFKPKICC